MLRLQPKSAEKAGSWAVLREGLVWCWDARRARAGVAVHDVPACGSAPACCSAAEERRGALRTLQRRTWGRENVAEADMGRCTIEAQQHEPLDGSVLTCQACGSAKPVAVVRKSGRWYDAAWGGKIVVEAAGTSWRQRGRQGGISCVCACDAWCSEDVVLCVGAALEGSAMQRAAWTWRGGGLSWDEGVVADVVGVAGDAEGGMDVGGCWGAFRGTRVAAADVVVARDAEGGARDAEGSVDVGARGGMPTTRQHALFMRGRSSWDEAGAADIVDVAGDAEGHADVGGLIVASKQVNRRVWGAGEATHADAGGWVLGGPAEVDRTTDVGSKPEDDGGRGRLSIYTEAGVW
ncbi:hypothetical protein B0H17DRAFT_1135875 [Mycena rosella]|uniref:Uncharacterized protein n=1 Tax=Mycena rosella TaxID=1033263 RepID=A0AAD7GHC4_MYCRO|nr:hypothetical protein B0H17DRAFT_1135875 [Mycena rosella]